MYLKNLEVIGFKSFAERTKLDFEPGMTAIVGPNGCGKSNIADAIRWVLGEQSAKALRGSKMEDCIFNGTDTHKPLGMAEVNLTIADCESALGTEYNEVTVTRRVFRTGEGQYFINKTPCRLKDIQRLFMDTGVGTNSYSLMEQGRIDLILSSRPEDRREVFEEASGITKFKADKKEAIRKLDHTEANLLRLADIIREVKRQIISLQRQAGKARRYQVLQEQLRGLDVYATRERLGTLNQEVSLLETKLAGISEQDEALRADVAQAEAGVAASREELARIEQEISKTIESSVQAKTELDRAAQLIRINEDRIEELKTLSERDSRDMEEARLRVEQHQAAYKTLLAELEKATAERDAAERGLVERTAVLAQHEGELEKARRLLHDLNNEAIDLESQAAHLQNEMTQIEAQERTSAIRRERLAAEQAEMQRQLGLFEERRVEMDSGLAGLRDEVNRLVEALKKLTTHRSENADKIKSLQQTMSEARTKGAARKAQIDLLQSNEARVEGFPGGARLLLDSSRDLGPVGRESILGSLAEQIHAEPVYRTALEAVLRAWLDAVVVQNDETAIALLRELEKHAEGSARMLIVKSDKPQPPALANGPGVALIEHVKSTEHVHHLLERLLWNVRAVNDLSQLPSPIPAEAVYVTLAGAIARGNGSFEYWMPQANEINPLAQRHLLADWQQDMDALSRQCQTVEGEYASALETEKTLDRSIEQARIALEEGQRKLALREGETQVIAQEARQARDRAETVTVELDLLKQQHDTGGGRRSEIHQELEKVRNRQADIRSLVATKTNELRDHEQKSSESRAEVTECRVQYEGKRQSVDHLASDRDPLQTRIVELETLIQERKAGVNSYQTRIEELKQSIAATQNRLAPLEADVQRLNGSLETLRREKDGKTSILSNVDSVLRGKRDALEEIRARKSQADVELAEQRIRRQNLIDRVTADYHLTMDQVMTEPEPAWENGQKLDREQMETTIAEIRTKLDAMGPVNLVAIEEHRELEERYAFLTQQQDDLVKAKQQLMDMIRRINKTTTEMFSKTFDQVNINFQELFKKLFGGGSAKLVMVNEEDVLESGIEIIARPPGKKLQTVSLLSGGERTMTAVALLFSLYMVKPSPFCLLDELDAALDEANIGRFTKMLQEFLVNSQFVVITHNRQTISAAGVLYGVTMQQHGVSKIVSVKFSNEKKKTFDQPSGQPENKPEEASAPETPAPAASEPVEPVQS